MNTEDPLPKSQERKLAERAADGDSEAVGELYDAYERRLFGYCARMLGNPEDAADATQEAFCNVIQRLPGLDTAQLNFGAYLFTAARNASLDILKSQGRFQSTDEVPEDPFAVAPVESDPERALLIGDQMRAAREANARLPEKQRAALALREVAELSYDDIGEALDMNQNAVAQLISRARMNFGKQLRVGSVVVAPDGEEAQRALDLMAARIDGKIAADDSDWLTAHLATNESSRLNAEAMEESAVLYRGIGVVAALAGMRETTLARATGADGSSGGGSNSAHDPGADQPTLVQDAPTVMAKSGDEADLADELDGELDGETRRNRQRLIYPIAAVLILLLILAVAAIGEGEPDQASDVVPGVTTSTSKASGGKTGGEIKSGSKGDPRSSQAQSGTTPDLASGNSTPGSPNSKKKSSGGDRNKSESPSDPDTPTSSDPATPPATPPAEDPPPPSTPPPGGGIPSGPGNICAQQPCDPPAPVP